MILPYERTWCDYLTVCPFINKENEANPIYVGEYECSLCEYFGGFSDSFNVPDAKDIYAVVCQYNEK